MVRLSPCDGDWASLLNIYLRDERTSSVDGLFRRHSLWELMKSRARDSILGRGVGVRVDDTVLVSSNFSRKIATTSGAVSSGVKQALIKSRFISINSLTFARLMI
jgi:hypothetical protein